MAVSTICQASTVMNNHSWKTFIPNGYVHSQKFSTRDTMSAQHIKRSTTLFPMRMNEDSSASVSSRETANEHNQSVSASNCSDIRDSSVIKYGRVIESLTTNDVPSSSNNIKKSTNDLLRNVTQKNIELPADSCDLGSSSSKKLKESPNRRKLSLGRIPNFLKCFTCERMIKEDHFSEHLLFGTVKCSDCNASFKDCQGFQMWATEYALGNVMCDHSFNYSGDPVAYLTGKLSTNHADNVSVLETTKITTLLENYIYKLKSLEERLPWRHAVESCKDFLAVKQSECVSLNGNVPSDASKDAFGIAKRSKFISSFTGKKFTNDRINCSSPTVEEESLAYHVSRDINLGQVEEASEFVSTPETFSTVESQSPQVTAPETSFSTAESLSRKVLWETPKETKKTKKKPDSWVIGETSKKLNGASREFVTLPTDGFYYVATEAIEECPNCYEVLCPSQFKVNFRTFLVTVICIGCNLTIYITSPQVQILTEGDQEVDPKSVHKNTQKPKSRKKSRGRSKKKSMAGNGFFR